MNHVKIEKRKRKEFIREKALEIMKIRGDKKFYSYEIAREIEEKYFSSPISTTDHNTIQSNVWQLINEMIDNKKLIFIKEEVGGAPAKIKWVKWGISFI